MAAFCYVCGSATPPAIDRRTGEISIPDGVAPPPNASAELIRKLQESLGKHYELAELIGRGGFAEVFRVRDLWLKRDLALKAIRADLTMSETLLTRFRREAEAVAALRHPNIVPIYDVGEAEGTMYILMPLIKGESLKSLLVRDGRRPITEAKRILMESASALEAAHEAGVIHRDIKPENIMLEGKARRVLLMDFGIAKIMDATADSSLTSTGTIVGTPHYMSPEQASGDPHIDHRTDQYSLAVVGYHMLTGAVPFEGESTRAILFKQMMESPRSMRELVPEVPEQLMGAIAKGMAKEPAERFPNIEAFAKSVEVAEEHRAVPVPVAPKRRSLAGPLVGAAGLVAVALVVALLWQGSQASPAPGRGADSVPVAVTPPPAPPPPPATADSGVTSKTAAIPPPAAGPPRTAARESTAGRRGTGTAPGSAGQRTTINNPAPIVPTTPTCASTARGSDLDAAFRICTDEAEKGNTNSQRLLASLYDRSQVPDHAQEAARWYRTAGDAGDVEAMHRYAEMLQAGKGVTANPADATTWFRKAAEQGHVQSMVTLGQRYEAGLGIRKDETQAYFWYRRAADPPRENIVAQAKLGEFFSRGRGVGKDEAEAVRWWLKAAERGEVTSQYGLGMAYLRGRGVQRSDSTGYEWLAKAAAQGHVEAKKEVDKRRP
ncbi:MAG: serine/threonine-protein kinase [Gemmatimonadales bacterium]